MNASGIYKIENVTNGKVYVGSSAYLMQRTHNHLYALIHNRHTNKHLQSAWNLYGEESFIFSLLELCDRDKLAEREQHYIDFFDCYRNGYNKAPLAMSCTGVTWSEDQKARYSVIRTALHFRHTEETKQRIGDLNRGKPSPRKGLTLPETHKHNISLSWNGRAGIPRTEETKLKIGAFHRGKPLSEEHKGKISLATMGKKKSPYHRKHYRVPWNKGLKMSDRKAA